MAVANTAVQDLAKADQLAYKNRFLETLQLRERNDEAGLIGLSEFVVPQILTQPSHARSIPSIFTVAIRLGGRASAVGCR